MATISGSIFRWGKPFENACQQIPACQTDFAKITFDARLYQRLFGKQVVAFHIKGGYASSGAPFYERFYLGGANSLRGYADRRLTPEGWGTKLILTNSELRFPLSDGFPNQKVTGVLFFDAGGIWQTGQDTLRSVPGRAASLLLFRLAGWK